MYRLHSTGSLQHMRAFVPVVAGVSVCVGDTQHVCRVEKVLVCVTALHEQPPHLNPVCVYVSVYPHGRACFRIAVVRV